MLLKKRSETNTKHLLSSTLFIGDVLEQGLKYIRNVNTNKNLHKTDTMEAEQDSVKSSEGFFPNTEMIFSAANQNLPNPNTEELPVDNLGKTTE